MRHLEDQRNIWLNIFNPFNICLAPGASENLVWMVLEKMCAFLSYPEVSEENKEKLINFIGKTDDVVTEESLGAFMEVYNNCLERCVLPKTTIYLTMNICDNAIKKMKGIEDNQIKDKTLSRQAIQQLSKMNIKGPMEKGLEII